MDEYQRELIAYDMGLNNYCHVNDCYVSCNGKCDERDIGIEYEKKLEEYYKNKGE